MRRRDMRIDDVFYILSDNGVVISDYSPEGYVYGYTKELLFYFLTGRDVRIAVRKTFDRWANSTDFICRWPKSEADLVALVRVATERFNGGHYDEGIGREVDISGLLRKAKRQIRKERLENDLRIRDILSKMGYSM